jgi:hypothetical protein
MTTRQLVILSNDDAPQMGAMAPIGNRDDVISGLAACNTGPESPANQDVLYGPGIRIELTPHQDPISQMLVTVTEEEIGWFVLSRLVKEFRWKLLDPNTGMEMGAQGNP